MGTDWTEKPAADPETSWTDKPETDPTVTWADKPATSPTDQDQWDWFPTREDADRLARDWETQRLCFRETEDWTDWVTEQMGEGGVPGGPPPAGLSSQIVSVDFDGVTEYMRDSSGFVPAAGGLHTISAWIKVDSSQSAFSHILCAFEGTPGSNVLYGYGFYVVEVGGILYFRVLAYHSSARINTWDYSVPAFGLADTWKHYTSTVNFIDPPPTDQELFIDGVGVVPTQSNTVLSTRASGFSTGTIPRICDGGILGYGYGNALVYDFAHWGVILDDATILGMYNGGDPVDYSVDTPGIGYESSADLYHWFRFGHDASDIGKDYGVAAGSKYDLMDDAANIDATDISSDWPGA